MARAARLCRLEVDLLHCTRVLRKTDVRLLNVQRCPKRSIASYTYSHHAAAISVLPTKVDVSSAEYKKNAQQMGEVMRKMTELHAKIEVGGHPKARDKHIARGKMLPREYVPKSPECH